MQCPKCGSDMEIVVHENVEIDRCTNCKGLWFDAGEIGPLLKPKLARAVDIGDADTGAHTNAIDRYPCPRCSGAMVRMVDARQSHIWYEKCASCGGTFFDAGEFRDLAKVSIADFFKTLSTPERR
ncbi:MAG: zf-TFIIB domain-containing protein [Pseudomonadota bacterium]